MCVAGHKILPRELYLYLLIYLCVSQFLIIDFFLHELKLFNFFIDACARTKE